MQHTCPADVLLLLLLCWPACGTVAKHLLASMFHAWFIVEIFGVEPVRASMHHALGRLLLLTCCNDEA
jgi:hypothetical protein